MGASSAESVRDGEWHHGALTWDGTVLKLFLDGFVAASTERLGAGDVWYSGGGIAIGRDGDAAWYFEGFSTGAGESCHGGRRTAEAARRIPFVVSHAASGTSPHVTDAPALSWRNYSS